MPDRTRLELELDSTDDPIQGHVGFHDEPSLPFTGWLELIAAVHRLTTGQRVERHPEATPNDRIRHKQNVRGEAGHG